MRRPYGLVVGAVCALGSVLFACLDLGGVPSSDDATDGGGAADGGSGSDAPAGGGEAGCDGGVCTTVCGSTTCGPHMRCAADGVTCECAVGYTAGSGGACTWSGGPKDPAFAASPPVWQFPADAGMTYDPAADGGGLVDPGHVTFGYFCGAGSLSQTFAMPTVAEGEALALETSMRCNNCSPSPDTLSAAHFFLGTRHAPLPAPGSSYGLVRTCLGERAFGGDVTLMLVRGCGLLDVDHAGFAADPKCPSPGNVYGGDFEAPGTWSANGSTAEVIASGASTVGHLAATTTCADPSLAGGWVNVPTAGGGKALALTHNGHGVFRVGLGKTDLAEITGTSVPAIAHVCIPDWARGMAWPISLRIPTQGPRSSCGTRDVDFRIDDISMVDDPACASDGFAFDPSFESGAASAHYFWGDSNASNGGIVAIDNAQPFGGGGAHALKVATSGCPSIIVTGYLPLSVPEVGATGPGPVLRFKAAASQSTNASSTYSLRSEGIAVLGDTALPPPSGATYASVTQCIPRTLGGRPLTLQVSVNVSSDCNVASMIDELSLGTDPGCP